MLVRSAHAHRCAACDADYPIILGIPDFRIFPDPWIGIVEDREKATRLASLIADASVARARLTQLGEAGMRTADVVALAPRIRFAR